MLFGFMFDFKIVPMFGLQVDPFSSVSAAHVIGENVRHQIHKSHPEVTEVFIHIGIFPSLSKDHKDLNFLFLHRYPIPY